MTGEHEEKIATVLLRGSRMDSMGPCLCNDTKGTERRLCNFEVSDGRK